MNNLEEKHNVSDFQDIPVPDPEDAFLEALERALPCRTNSVEDLRQTILATAPEELT